MDQPRKNGLRRLYKPIILIILLIGLGLRSYQYFMGRSLWHDEAHLALNFVDHGFAGLTKPLDNYQSAPIFFLFAIEMFTRLFGFGELALRVAPLLLCIIALPLFFWLVRDLTRNATAALIALFIFCINISLVYYSSELKPYTVDVSVFVIMAYLAVSEHEFVRKRRTILLTIVGCLAVLFSNASTVVLTCVFSYLVLQAASKNNSVNKLPWKNLAIIAVCWAVVFVANYLKFIYQHPYADGMKQIWSHTFCPTPLFTTEFNDFIRIRSEEMFFSEMLYFNTGMFLPFPVVFLMLTGIGYFIYRGQYPALLLTVLPVLLHLCLSMEKLYPFHLRFILYLVPPIIILLSIGMGVIADVLTKFVHRSVAIIFVVFFLFQAAEPSVKQFPKWEIRIKPSVMYIDKHYPETKLLITTPLTMYQFYNKTGLVRNNNYDRIEWSLSPEQFLNLEVVKAQKSNFIMLHSSKGGDNTDPIIDELKKRGLIERQFFNNNFAVSEIRPVGQ